jgi:hypothetical protein
MKRILNISIVKYLKIKIMEKKAEVSKKIVAQAIIDKITNEKKPREIKTNLIQGYENPEKITIKDEKEGYIPDVKAEMTDYTELYEIELDRDYEIDKWLLFSKHLKKSKGYFYIVTPEENLVAVRDLLKTNAIDAKILYFNTR